MRQDVASAAFAVVVSEHPMRQALKEQRPPSAMDRRCRILVLNGKPKQGEQIRTVDPLALVTLCKPNIALTHDG